MALATRELAAYLDDYLRIAEVPDAANAWNGLQIENSGMVTRIAAAVDASQATIDMASRLGCDLLLVHHGLFWDGQGHIRGRRYRKLRALFGSDIAVYSAHLPLDIHPDIGNNVVLARALGIEVEDMFGDASGVALGVRGRLELSREALAARIDEKLGGRVRLLPGGPDRVARVGVITGGAGSMIAAAAVAGLDAFVTGEGAHHTYFDAMEEGINVYYAGHYATETWGVRELAAHVADRFSVEWEFIDLPTGL